MELSEGVNAAVSQRLAHLVNLRNRYDLARSGVVAVGILAGAGVVGHCGSSIRALVVCGLHVGSVEVFGLSFDNWMESM